MEYWEINEMQLKNIQKQKVSQGMKEMKNKIRVLY